MELEAFISTTLIQIARGVHVAQEEVRKYGGYVNPALTYSHRPEGFVGHAEGLPTYQISFDVAVTAGSQKATAAGIGVRVASLVDASAGGKSGKLEETVSRIRFSVPMALPIDEQSMKRKQQATADKKARDDAMIRGRIGGGIA